MYRVFQECSPRALGQLLLVQGCGKDYGRAKLKLENNLARQLYLDRRIQHEIPSELHQVTSRLRHLEHERSSKDNACKHARDRGHHQCRPFHSEYWYRVLLAWHHSHTFVYDRWPTFICRMPRPVLCNGLTDPFECEHREREYDQFVNDYHECNECKNAKSNFRRALNEMKSLEREITSLHRRHASLNDELRTSKIELQTLRTEEPLLRTRLQEEESKWLPNEQRCRALYNQYKEEHHAWMRVEVPTFYNVSCEKACLESSLKDAGCGVMEGVMRGEIWTRGDADANAGLEVLCAPPSASFVMTPVKYGAKAETEQQMCTRIFENAGQRPRRPQQIVKKSLLWKRERLWRRWRTRYFVLESGDNVRSAIIRYWDKDPSEPGAKERGTKAITLWDARGVKSESGRGYWWRGGEECFRLQHFYRDYVLCTTHNHNAERNQWVELIRPEIRFPSNYR